MVEQFDKVFVISDLHLGGRTGKRAFREGPVLAKFIDTVRDDPESKVALVINGDIVDFLADGPDTPEFNARPEAFLSMLNAKGDELKPVFTALGELVRDDRQRRLVLQLGNHDIELALPSAQQTFRELLSITDPLHRARLSFETSGKGWICQVGPHPSTSRGCCTRWRGDCRQDSMVTCSARICRPRRRTCLAPTCRWRSSLQRCLCPPPATTC